MYCIVKIAHINNTSGLGTKISKEQEKKYNHQTKVFVFSDIVSKQFGGEKYNYNSRFSKFKFFNEIKNFDVWHYHYPYGSLKSSLEKKKNKDNNKILIKHYHGSDLRGKFEDEQCFVSTPDLLKFAPNGIWIPIAIDVDEILRYDKRQKRNNEVKKIAHYPYYKIRKTHGDNYSKTLNIIKNEYNCEIVEIINVKHNEAISLISECDIVIGKIMPEMGWFSTFELEGMLLGKPVIAYVSNELYEKYKPPIYITTKDTFEKDLVNLLEDEKTQKKLAVEGKTYVCNRHAVDKVVDMIERYYR